MKLALNINPVPPRAIVLDTETTGFTPVRGDKIVEIAMAEVVNGAFTGRTFHHMINPGRSIPRQASDVHGITNARVAKAPRFRDIAAGAAAFIGSPDTPLWAHNAAFDARFINAEMGDAGQGDGWEVLCSLKLARRLDLGLSGATLAILSERAGYQWGARGAHSAIEDTLALTHVLTTLLWPREAALAQEASIRPDPTPRPVPSPRPATPRSAPAAASSATPSPVAPRDFTPLDIVSDPRIRRYDGVDFSAMLHARSKRWSVEEERVLVDAFIRDGAAMETVVERIGRTPGALIHRLSSLGFISENHPYAATRR